MSRLLHTGQVIVDLVMGLDTLPASGGDVLANSASFQVGGGFNVMAAARRNGLPVVYLGRHGDGRFGELARAAMQAEGVEMALAASAGKDTGLCVSLTEASTERTFISHLGAEGELSADDLAQIVPRIDDYVYVSGYSLLLEGKAQPLLDWLLALPREIVVVFDPGPLVKAPDSALMRALLPRIDIWTSNGPEALAFTGAADMSQALPMLNQHLQALLVVRDGPNGCWVGRGVETEHVPGFKVQAVDSNGAGDAHAGVFIAGLAQGLKPVEAARRANAAAALAVTRWGPATSPGVTEVDALLAE
ncbi:MULTISPECIES: PfkB family carbohydrate kinase [Pseudomonas]|jgi:sugar/nucleoside kinase (ribokinase family)|uniref:PfkB family carbohydrate kinase n=1 Tax=Pseudomonas carnis TaxID=2487355 RepID=A0ABT5RFT4_9PSED|nr:MULTISPECIES: PfkB family carbohydrate kinase [Pseudomonas]MBA1256174.1 sugar kinase [Pseudomonas carnis]MBA1268112.1 sugar kinase [Pseudomonas carnis]MBA1299931.1 sugar kinase [Pseudomonas carnis]MBJ2201243.1 bifunctional hydroxymethylpyrimidine kinase/phosphomethylpyrimidine kinase [Pseudomonas carnis]MBJ2226849.1 bifunctional hydroxymethylpyrimidine kinase/phosphomethylpyrimidine kinase [Pseudomonas sp. MF7451]